MIRVKGVTKAFDSVKALDDIDLTLEEGSIYGLIGSNGSGKSTLLRLISGVYTPDSGRVEADGVGIFNNPQIKSDIVYVGDTPFFFSHATIKEMAKFYRLMYPSFNEDTYNRMLEIFPLDPNAKISTMSKGMQRQAALINAVAATPKYLLLDEAFDGLDVVIRRVLKEILIEGAESRSMTTVIASHNLRELDELCDRVGLIHNGKIIFGGEIETLRSSIHKIQMAFKSIPETSVFDNLDVLKIERSGSVINMIARGDGEEIIGYVNKLNPIFAERIEPTLEEMFIYELEVTGYDVKSIIK